MKKGPSKNIFLSFQAISLIPDELQGRMLWMWVSRWQRRDLVVAIEHARFNVCEHELEYICITEKICLMAAFFFIGHSF